MTKYFLSLLLVISLYSCNKNTVDPTPQTPISTAITQETFESFYNKFHKDSLFQMSRIKFPLQGKLYDHGEEVEWKKENWSLFIHSLEEVDTTQYKISREITPQIITEKVWIQDSGFFSEMKYEYLNNEWFLTYYNEINN
ncbi:hypothetical protein [Flavobacterium sp. '19STA2R22 D10 B1']|uniref:hypothetical protein n=1 Tax=Flavobacterium aerium TaxID=3037261 RepID=UPI00278C66BD|nr:hypothetical protein [Flavobacterium sp. '19STA2R22 D10 B1']